MLRWETYTAEVTGGTSTVVRALERLGVSEAVRPCCRLPGNRDAAQPHNRDMVVALLAAENGCLRPPIPSSTRCWSLEAALERGC